MLICLCRAVSDRDVKHAIQQGARRVRCVGQRTGAGTCCGSCRVDLHSMLKVARTEQSSVANGGIQRQG